MQPSRSGRCHGHAGSGLVASLQNGKWREWRDARIASLRLLEAGFAASSHGIPAALGGQAWKLIETACEDPDPVPAAEAEARASGRNLDELDLELVRPQALTTVTGMFIWPPIDDQRQRSLATAGLQSMNTSEPLRITAVSVWPGAATRRFRGLSRSVTRCAGPRLPGPRGTMLNRKSVGQRAGGSTRRSVCGAGFFSAGVAGWRG